MTPKQWEAVRSELEKVCKCRQKKGQSLVEYVKDVLVEKANALSDDDWDDLTEDTGNWVNEAIRCIEEKEPLPLPKEALEYDTEDADGEEAEEEGEEEVTEAKPKGHKRRGAAKEKEEKKAPDKKAPDKKAAKKANGRGRPARFDDKAKITVLTDNPHRTGTKDHELFKKFKDGMTVAKALSKGVTRYAINWYHDREHIEVNNPS